MAIVVKSPRFPEDELAEIGPGSYISQKEYKVKQAIIPFGSLSTRENGQSQEEPTRYETRYDSSSILDSEKPNMIDHSGSTMIERTHGREKTHNSSAFSNKEPRIAKKICNKVPGPGSYALPNLTEELLKRPIKTTSLRGKLVKGFIFSERKREANEQELSDLSNINQRFLNFTDSVINPQKSDLGTTNTEASEINESHVRIEEQTRGSILTNKIRGIRFHKPDNPFKEPSYIPITNELIGPGSYIKRGSHNNIRSFVRDMNESPAFRSKTFREKPTPVNITNCDFETQVKYWAPGPGSYELSHNISTGRTEMSSKSGLNNTKHTKSYNTNLAKFDNDSVYKEIDYQRLYSYMSGCRNSVAGPGSYNLRGSPDLKSYKKIIPNIGFNVNDKRFKEDPSTEKDISKNTLKNKPIVNREFDEGHFKTQAENVRDIKLALDEAPAFNSSEARMPLDPILKKKAEIPGPDTYTVTAKYVQQEKESLNPFKSKADRGQLKQDPKTRGTVANYMLDLVDKEKKAQEDRLQIRRSKNEKQISKKIYKKPDGMTDMSKRLEHCFQTTLPLNNLPSTLQDCVGDMHLIHLHDANNPRERLVMHKPLPVIPFKTSENRVNDKPVKPTPGPTDYVNAHKVDWNTKTFNVQYLQESPEL